MRDDQHSVALDATPRGDLIPAVFLPGDIEAHRIKLVATREELLNHARIMDGYLFGYVGLDGVVGLVPIVGEALSGLTTLWILAKASQVRMSAGDRLVIFGLGALDVGIGSIPVAGDAVDFFFRAHAWNTQRKHPLSAAVRQLLSARGLPSIPRAGVRAGGFGACR